MEVQTEQGTVRGIPYIYRSVNGEINKKAPHVILLHQFTLSKERMETIALRLAEKGISTLAIDLPEHGEREAGYFDQPKGEQWKNQGKILIQGVKDIGILHQLWMENGFADESTSWAIVGLSMGAMVAYGSLAEYGWLQAGVHFIGSPTWETFLRDLLRIQKVENEDEAIYEELRPWDPIHKWKSLSQKNMLMINAEQDLMVPGKGSRKLMEILQEKSVSQKASLIEIKDVGHRVTSKMIDQGVEWLEERLMDGMDVNA